MAGQFQDDQQTGRPKHTPEEERAFDERIELLGEYAELADDGVDPAVFDRIEDAYERGSLEDLQLVRHLWWHRWYLIPILLVIAILVAVAVFYFGSGEDLTASLDENSGAAAAIEDWVAENLEAASPSAAASSSQDPSPAPSTVDSDVVAEAAATAPTDQTSAADVPADAPSHFVGAIVSDNGWFRIVVELDGSVSGTLNVAMEVPGGSVTQTGSYTGTIDDENSITCLGQYQGISVDEKGREYPHEGSVTLVARPTGEGTTAWEINADGEPGDPVTLTAHSQ